MATPLRANDPSRIGPYVLIGRLGEGGQGVVFLGRRPDGLEVAVKLLRADLADDPAARARFVKELAATKRVAAAWTARVLDADVDSDRPYVVSEYVAGPSLQQLVADRGSLAGAELERLAAGTLTALAGVHDAGVAHRDFKPANVLLDTTGPRVIDFGIARALDTTATLTSSVIGTPAYMAPEQISPPDGSPVGPAADVWAWGATMVYAATGRTPFGADSVVSVMHGILFGTPDLTGFPDSPLRRLVSACLVKDPRERPTARAALGSLTRDPNATMPLAPAPAEPPPVSRRTVAVAGTLGVAAATAAFWYGLAAYGDRPPDETSGDLRQPAKRSPTRPAKGVRLPGTNARLASDLDGDLTLSAYYSSSDAAPYVWIPSAGANGAFRRQDGDPPHSGLEVSPDGRRAVGNYAFDAGPEHNDVTIYDRVGGALRPAMTIRPPVEGSRLEEARWSPDGTRLLIEVLKEDADGSVIRPYGLLLVTPDKGDEGELIPAPDRWAWAWLPDGTGFASNPRSTVDDRRPDVEFRDLTGKVLSVSPNAGRLATWGYGPFDPDGTYMLTVCDHEMACVYSMDSPDRVAQESPLPPVDQPDFEPPRRQVGWYGQGQLLTERKTANGVEAVVTDSLSGKVLQTLVTSGDTLPTLDFSVSPY